MAVKKKAQKSRQKRVYYWKANKKEKEKLLRELYPEGSRQEIEKVFPGVGWDSIVRHAQRLGIKKENEDAWTDAQRAAVREYAEKIAKTSHDSDERKKFWDELISKSGKQKNAIHKWAQTNNISFEYKAPAVASPVAADSHGLSDEERDVLLLLHKAAWKLADLESAVGKNKETLVKILDSLRRKGYNVSLDRAHGVAKLERETTVPPTSVPLYRRQAKILFLADPELGHRWSQTHIMRYAYKVAEKENVDAVILAGNIFASRPRPDDASEFFLIDRNQRLDYGVRFIPKAGRAKTYCLSGYTDMGLARFEAPGSHKKKKTEGFNIVMSLCQARPGDLVYRGDYSHKFDFKGVQIFVQHAKSDDTAQAKSYYPQGMVENLAAAADSFPAGKRPRILILAGYRIPLHIRRNGMDVWTLPTLKALSPSQLGNRKRGLLASVGFGILTIDFDENWKPKKREDGTDAITMRGFPCDHVQQEDVHLVDVQNITETDQAKSFNDLERKALAFLVEKPHTQGEIARSLGVDKAKVVKIIGRLEANGFGVPMNTATNQYSFSRPFRKPEDFDQLITSLEPRLKPVSVVKQGVLSDLHLCSVKQQPAIIRMAYKVFESEKVDVIYIPGDVHDGQGDIHRRDKKREVIPSLEWFSGQLYYSENVLPKSDKIPEKVMIGGNHDEWFLSSVGADIMESLAKRRPDLKYLNSYTSEEHELKGIRTEMIHPDGGPGYALTAKLQKLIHSVIAENQKANDPANQKAKRKHVIIAGNWHVYASTFFGGVLGVNAPTTQAQTEYLKRKNLGPDVGFVINTVGINADGRVVEYCVDYRDCSHLIILVDYPRLIADLLAKEWDK